MGSKAYNVIPASATAPQPAKHAHTPPAIKRQISGPSSSPMHKPAASRTNRPTSLNSNAFAVWIPSWLNWCSMKFSRRFTRSLGRHSWTRGTNFKALNMTSSQSQAEFQ
ncbi:uncharacterized protein LOC120356003 [Nilaparvata lugens]|uniref:uncharacterized protein LOC120356003 n=1 Tax=Nilaparvata lugens TaxID=108931 RepID=UPI00193E8007|nr:uncharacterized protein LOC120356003 [Nilaparvata lugens]